MIVETTAQFDAWFRTIKDDVTKARLLRRLDKIERGLWGDIVVIDPHLIEAREHFGPGWRLYCTDIDIAAELIIALYGGTKRTQKRDIKTARSLLEDHQKDRQ